MIYPCQIQLPYTRESLVYLLACGAHPDTSPYTHKSIAKWCEIFWLKYADIDAPEEIEQLMPVLADVETQWDCYEGCSATEVNWMPVQWFEEWQQEIGNCRN
jgi:hypothetical protein